jgi:hypothetical protein
MITKIVLQKLFEVLDEFGLVGLHPKELEEGLAHPQKAKSVTRYSTHFSKGTVRSLNNKRRIVFRSRFNEWRSNKN